MTWRRLAIIALLAALPCAGQSAAPLSASSGTLAERTLNATQSGLYYLPTNPPTLTTVTATALSTPGSITVTPVLTKVASITTVAGSALVDGDYFTVEYATGLTVPIEFDLSPGDGTTGGRVPLLFTAGDSANTIRDNIITLLNSAAGPSLTASSGGAATVSIVLDTPGATGGTLTENVTDAGFAVSGFSDPTHATTVTYKLVAKLADGSATEAGAASTTTTSVATLNSSNFNRLAWSAVANAASYDVYRTVSPTSPATTGKIIATTTALTIDDTGLAGDSGTAPTANGTGLLSGSLRSTSITPVTASKLLGRGDSGAGAAQEITLGTGLSMSGTTLSAAGGALSGGTAGRLGIWTAADAQSSHPGLLADATTGALTIGAQSDIVPVTLRAYSSGTSAITQWQTSGNGPLAEVTHAGCWRLWGLYGATDYERYTLCAAAGTGVTLTAETGGTGVDNLDVTVIPAGDASVVIKTGNSTYGQVKIQNTGDGTDKWSYLTFGDTNGGSFRQHGSLGNLGNSPAELTFLGLSGWQLAIKTLGANPIYITPGGGEYTNVTGLKVVSGAKPTCDATARGVVWYVAGGTGVADTFEVCRKDNLDAYAWVTLF